ncbi:MAG TPA: hypothetical protein VG497_03200 [Kribbella sp.]|nr:hypothetical protein [Kribbella sp.]
MFEHGRLVVEHRARELGLGRYLNALAIGAAHHLGARALIGPSGTRDGQDRFHERFGFRPVRGTRRYVPQYTEDVVLMLHRVADGGGRHHDLVTRLRDEFPVIAAASVTPARRVTLADFAAPDRDVWRPVLHTASDVEALLATGNVREVHDTLDEQLAELGSEHPAEPREHGTWAWYPWSGRLVHVLPRAEFRRLRAAGPLSGKRIGVLGRPSAALALAREGIGGAFKLADPARSTVHDGVHDLGVGKGVLAARQLAELDPYLDVEVECAELAPETIERFFGGGLDLLVDGSDAPWVKIAAREYARALGIPVVAHRGVLDIERFDREPDRPLLHGLADLPEPGRRDLTAAMVEAARRILLGQPCESGRFPADVDEPHMRAVALTSPGSAGGAHRGLRGA